MTKIQRIKSVLFALLMILAAILIFLMTEDGYKLITLMIWVSLTLSALRQLVYYFSMARHMVGGRLVLYKAIIFLDLALFTRAVIRIPRAYVLIYLSVLFGFAGLVDVLHSLESRRVGGSWRFNLSHGILNIILAGICLVFIRTGRLVEVIYGISLISSAILRIISATRRTAVVYIA